MSHYLLSSSEPNLLHPFARSALDALLLRLPQLCDFLLSGSGVGASATGEMNEISIDRHAASSICYALNLGDPNLVLRTGFWDAAHQLRKT